MSDVNRPSWELKRKTGPGAYRTYAHGYFRPLTLTVFTRRGPRTLVGAKKIAALWAQHEGDRP
jgi:hypothetical protein